MHFCMTIVLTTIMEPESCLLHPVSIIYSTVQYSISAVLCCHPVSVRPSVRHVRELRQNEIRYLQNVFTIW